MTRDEAAVASRLRDAVERARLRSVETIEAYFGRKRRELQLIGAYLASPYPVDPPRSTDEHPKVPPGPAPARPGQPSTRRERPASARSGGIPVPTIRIP